MTTTRISVVTLMNDDLSALKTRVLEIIEEYAARDWHPVRTDTRKNDDGQYTFTGQFAPAELLEDS